MTASGFFSALLVGLQAIGCLMTLLLGIIGAVAGAAVAHAANVHWWLLVLACQVGVAAVGVAVVAGTLHRRRT